jgi:Tol biopolymer transport system component
MRIKAMVLLIKYWLCGFMLITLLSCSAHFDCGANKPYSRGEWYRCGGTYQGANPSMSNDGKKIVFGSTRYGLGDIIIMNSDGTEWKKLTDTQAYEGDPSFSPDGGKIVFISERNGNGEIYIMNSDGSEQTRLTISDYYNGAPSFSPDGTKIVFDRVVSDEAWKIKRSQIFIMNVDGTDQKRLTYDFSSAGPPSFSPDGKKIIFTYRKEGTECLAIMDLDGSNVVNLIRDRDHYFSEPSFSSDGRNIVFRTDWHEKDHMDIHVMDIRETKPKHIKALKKGDYSIEHPTFINGDTKIMFFATRSEKGGEICTINLDGSDFKVIAKSY